MLFMFSVFCQFTEGKERMGWRLQQGALIYNAHRWSENNTHKLAVRRSLYRRMSPLSIAKQIPPPAFKYVLTPITMYE